MSGRRQWGDVKSTWVGPCLQLRPTPTLAGRRPGGRLRAEPGRQDPLLHPACQPLSLEHSEEVAQQGACHALWRGRERWYFNHLSIHTRTSASSSYRKLKIVWISSPLPERPFIVSACPLMPHDSLFSVTTFASPYLHVLHALATSL